MQSIEKTKVRVYLTLSGKEFCTDFVTEKIGIVPNNIRLCDEKLKNGCAFGHTEWGIETEWTETLTIMEALLPIIKIIEERRDVFRIVKRHCNAQWGILIVIEIWDEKQPALYFSRKCLETFSEIQADVGIDYYYYYNDIGINDAISNFFDK